MQTSAIKGVMDESSEIKKQPVAEKLLLTRAEICEELGVSPTTIWRWRKAKMLCPVVLGYRTLRYRRCDISRLLERFNEGSA